MNTENTESRAKAEGESAPRNLDLLEELGGPQGIADSSIPSLVFVVVFTLAGSRVGLASLFALGAGVAIALLRLLKGESLRFALIGVLGVALSAFIASRTGRAENFFLPGLLFNFAYAAIYFVSILIRRPLLGVLLGPVFGEGKSAWRDDPHQLRVYSQASWIWVGIFTLRVAVQLPFYLAGSVVALGIAKVVMGFPVFALAVWLSYLVLKRGGIVTTWRGIFTPRAS